MRPDIEWVVAGLWGAVYWHGRVFQMWRTPVGWLVYRHVRMVWRADSEGGALEAIAAGVGA